MQQLNMMQQQAQQKQQLSPASPQSSHNLSTTRSEADEKMDESGSDEGDDHAQIDEMENVGPLEISEENSEMAEVKVQ